MHITLPRLRDDQQEIVDNDRRFKGLFCGRRWGKDTTGVWVAVLGHGPVVAENGRRQWPGALHGANIWYFGLTNGQARFIWRTLKRSLRYGWVSKSEVDKRIVLPGGGSIAVKSAQLDDGARGEGLDGALFTELAFYRSLAIWKDTVRPALSDRGGWAMWMSTPPDEANEFTEELESWEANDAEWVILQRPSSDNPLLTEAELESARRELGPERFAREYLAQLLFRGGSIIRREWLRRTWSDLPKTVRRVLSLDTSLKSGIGNDFSAWSVWGETQASYPLLDMCRGKVNTTALKRSLWLAYLKWEPDAVLIEDSARGSELLAEIERGEGELAKLPAIRVPTGNRKDEKVLRLELVQPIFEGLKVELPEHHPDTPAWIAEHLAFPGGKNDDWVDTTSMALGYLKRPERVAKGRAA